MPLSLSALSGLSGSISIACWIVVFTPQILENFRRGAADGLSLLFVVVWLLGDVFNILGAVLQGVIPTMTILAVYYTFADFVLLGQCLWYRRRRGKGGGEEGMIVGGDGRGGGGEREPLLGRREEGTVEGRVRRLLDGRVDGGRGAVDGTHLSPATPFVVPTMEPASLAAPLPRKGRSNLSAAVFNVATLVLVCLAGVLGWFLTTRSLRSPPDSNTNPLPIYQAAISPASHSPNPSPQPSPLNFDPLGQFFGWLCAVLYLVSRIPQLLLNYRRKSTDGVSILFFLFACVGNLTYVLSIFAYEPVCARAGGDVGLEPFLVRGLKVLTNAGEGCIDGEWSREYGRYILVNASWLAGSAGTLLLDLGIFVQFWLYRGRESEVIRVGEN